MKRLKIRVKGRVQGVYYRASTEKFCQAKGICGFVRNEPDGSVYLEAESGEAELDALLKWVRKGPPLARVDAVDVEEIEVQNTSGFEVRRS